MNPKIVDRDKWRAARIELLEREKAASRMLDEVTQLRSELPWTRVTKGYVFESSSGSHSLEKLFGNNSQLIVYHFMLGPDWDEGCKSCSFLCDHFDGANRHLVHHDVTLAVVSRAPISKIDTYKQRMGWQFPWFSSYGSDFNFDYGVSFSAESIAAGTSEYNYAIRQNVASEMHGLSVFAIGESSEVFHTYSTYGRGLDILIGTHLLLDLTPNGRNEETPMSWVRHFDRYDANVEVA